MGRKMIYLDDAIEAIEEITWYHQSENGEMVKGANSQEHQAWYKAEDVYKVLNDLLSVQPEIILCPNCRYNDGTAYCEVHYRDVRAKDFCSWAERRRDANND